MRPENLNFSICFEKGVGVAQKAKILINYLQESRAILGINGWSWTINLLQGRVPCYGGGDIWTGKIAITIKLSIKFSLVSFLARVACQY